MVNIVEKISGHMIDEHVNHPENNTCVTVGRKHGIKMNTSPALTVVSSSAGGRHLTNCNIRRKRQQQLPSFHHFRKHSMLSWGFFVYSWLAACLGIPLRTVALQWHLNEYLMRKEVIGGKGCGTYLPNQIYFHSDTFPAGPCRAWRGAVS